jgi:hypothetical protein
VPDKNLFAYKKTMRARRTKTHSDDEKSRVWVGKGERERICTGRSDKSEPMFELTLSKDDECEVRKDLRRSEMPPVYIELGRGSMRGEERKRRGSKKSIQASR